jgi:hypothetical protein
MRKALRLTSHYGMISVRPAQAATPAGAVIEFVKGGVGSLPQLTAQERLAADRAGWTANGIGSAPERCCAVGVCRLCQERSGQIRMKVKMKSISKADFFLIKYKPDSDGIPIYFETIWSPELPRFHYPSGDFDRTLFKNLYSVKAKTKKLTGDWLINNLLASDRLLELCNRLGVEFISAEAKISLYRNEVSEKHYNFFIPSERLDLLNEEKSIFNISTNLETGKLATREIGLDSTYYDRIDKFIVRTDVMRDLFLCTELKKVVCSIRFKEKYEDALMSGVAFEPIDENFRYDPWSNFPS